MPISPAAQVGMVTVVGALILIFIMTAINPHTGAQGLTYYAVFERIEGLSVGSPVRMAGVTIGKVMDINIDQAKKVRVHFMVTYTQNGQPLELTKESGYTVTSNLLGDKWLEVIPRPGTKVDAGAEVQGTAPVTMDQLMAKGDEALTQLEGSIKEINKLVGDPEFQRNIKETVANFNSLAAEMRTAAANANRVITNLNGRVNLITGHVDDLVLGLQGQLHSIGVDFQALAKTMRRVGDENAPDIRAIVVNLRETAASVRSSMAAVNTLVKNKQLSEDILGTVASLRRSGEELEGIFSDVRNLTSDPQLQKDIKDGIHDARETVAGAKRLINGFQKGFGGGKGGFKLYDLRTEVEYNWRTDKVAPNAALTLLPDFKYSGYIGVDSIGQQNLVNVQVGVGKPSFKARFGVIRSKLGVGFDTLLFNRLGLSADIYNNRRVKMDLLGRMSLARDFYLMGGVRDVWDKSSPIIGLGKRF